jgi:hypothetical protein
LTPLLLLEYHQSELAFPLTATTIIDSAHTPAGPPCRLAFDRVTLGGRTCGIWFIERFARRWRSDTIRNLRVHLLRLHSEFEVLNHVLGLLTQKRLSLGEGPAREKLLGYLGAASGLLSRTSVYGNPQTPLLQTAYEFSELASPGKQSSLNTALQAVRPALADRVGRVIADVDSINP